MPKIILQTTEADNLRELRNRLARHGFESPLLDLRMDHNEHAKVLEYLSFVKSRSRVFHHLLPTQASGRWSVTNPPLVNFPEYIRDSVYPDPGEAWVGWDLDAIEGKIVAAYSHDTEDLAAFTKGYDIHTITACRMIGLELPPNLMNPHTSPECAEWRAKHKWQGKGDPRRILAKVRYALLYGKEWTAINGSKYEKDMVKLGFKREVMAEAARQFLKSKPGLQSTKKKYWDLTARNKEARTIFGRRRRLFGDYWTKAKEGWNHMVQGSVTDMVNLSLIDICGDKRLVSPRLVYPSHDAAKIAIPLHLVDRHQHGDLTHLDETLKVFKGYVEREWDVDGEKIVSTATWHIYYPEILDTCRNCGYIRTEHPKNHKFSGGIKDL